MKKFTITSLFLAAAFLTFGIVLLLIGVFRDGDIRQMWHDGEFSISNRSNLQQDFDRNYTESEFVEIFSSDTGELTSMNIEVNVGTLVVKTSSDNSWRVLSSGKKPVEAWQEKDTLTVVSKSNQDIFFHQFSLLSDNYCRTIVYLPEEEIENIRITMAAGCVKLYGCEAQNFTIDMSAGVFYAVDSQQFDRFTVEVDAGNIELNEVLAKSAMISCNVGNFSMSKGSFEEAKIDCDMGNVDLVLSGRKEEYGFNIDVAMGNVDIGSKSYSGMDSDYNLDGEKQMDISCNMGNVTVDFHN